MASQLHANNLLDRVAQNKVSTALGIRSFPLAETILVAKTAGYDSVFIDLEHTTLTMKDCGQLCITAMQAGITPFVRVPHQCGDGFIQRVLDAGAMGIVVPHIHGVEDSKKVIGISKYPPVGHRSLTGSLPHFDLKPLPAPVTAPLLNERGSTVFLMIETKDALENVDAIAALPGCDVLLVGANDLSIEIGTLPDFDHPRFIAALEKVSAACKKHGKIFGIGGLYHRPDLMERLINEMGCRWILGGLDLSLMLNGAKANCETLSKCSAKLTGKL
ncbi:2,4-dihydroxyhept-2-ene-1,7-dioic acid aldolase-like protein [Rhizodiscina lignyota]|uniref:2,4-dihydroxyhept-2-ene-1,7-dioic acid aldolase-like protein n=1 Tax=Rhizodiscina lignyota TaxID=1504668 RepID=A0A9P4IQB2_9PEZI|nr:2,4-dihydroxyhept-2-ene-1,7-dioic acid aldolase-like protein [Rhizodiscina lignyota]